MKITPISEYSTQQIKTIFNTEISEFLTDEVYNYTPGPELKILYPNSINTFYTSRTMPISWSAELGNLIPTSKIMYSSNSIDWITIANVNTVSSSQLPQSDIIYGHTHKISSYLWNIPSNLPTSDKYQLKIVSNNDYSGSHITASTDFDFTIDTKFIKVQPLQKQDREIIANVGQNVNVKWTSNATSEYVKISLLDANATNSLYSIIEDNYYLDSATAYSWTTDDIPFRYSGSLLAKLKIEDANDSSVYSISSASFNVKTPVIFSASLTLGTASVNFGIPRNPYPRNNTVSSLPYEVTLSWQGYSDTWTEIYFGETTDTMVRANTLGSEKPPFYVGRLKANTDYYWKVLAEHGMTRISGSIWKFRTAKLTDIPRNPYPIDNSDNQPTMINFTWTSPIGPPPENYRNSSVYLSSNMAAVSESTRDNPVARIDSNNNFTSSWYNKLKPNTKYYWKVDTTTGWYPIEGPIWSFTTAPETFEISNPTPTNGVIDQLTQVNFSWNGTNSEEALYTLYFGKNENALVALVDNWPETRYGANSLTLENNTKYYWKVSVKDKLGNIINSPIWNFTTIPAAVSPNAPTIPANPTPVDNITNVPSGFGNTATFGWTSTSPDSSELTYDVYYSFDGITSYVWKSNLIVPTFSIEGLGAGVTYYWKITAKNINGITSGPFWKFTTENPLSISNPYPAVGSVLPAQSTVLNWESPNADTYKVYLGTSGQTMTEITTKQGETISGLIPNTTYYWKVKVSNESTTTESDNWSFKTGHPVIPPTVPSNPTPEVNSVGIGVQDIQMSWNSVSNDGSPIIFDFYYGTDSKLGRTAGGIDMYPNITDITSSNFIWMPSTGGSSLIPNKEYYWAIRAKNKSGWTDGPIWKFTTKPN